MRIKGKIASWNDERGFGFILPDSDSKQVFIHIKSFQNNGKRPQIGTEVTFEIARDELGRLRGERIKISGISATFGPANKALLVAGIFLALVGIFVASGFLPIMLLWLYLGLSVLSLAIYAIDKSAAKKNAQRTSENTLHLISLLGGWPGALYAQQLLRHKSSKLSFRVVFWVTVVFNVGALGYLFSPHGVWLTKILKHIATDILKHIANKG